MSATLFLPAQYWPEPEDVIEQRRKAKRRRPAADDRRRPSYQTGDEFTVPGVRHYPPTKPTWQTFTRRRYETVLEALWQRYGEITVIHEHIRRMDLNENVVECYPGCRGSLGSRWDCNCPCEGEHHGTAEFLQHYTELSRVVVEEDFPITGYRLIRVTYVYRGPERTDFIDPSWGQGPPVVVVP